MTRRRPTAPHLGPAFVLANHGKLPRSVARDMARAILERARSAIAPAKPSKPSRLRLHIDTKPSKP